MFTCYYRCTVAGPTSEDFVEGEIYPLAFPVGTTPMNPLNITVGVNAGTELVLVA